MGLIGSIVALLLILTFGVPFGFFAVFIVLATLGVISTMLYQFVLRLFRS